MAYKIKFIKNPPSAEDLIELYNSELYEEIIFDFVNQTNVDMDSEDDIQLIRQVTTRRYLILNIPIEEVVSELKSFKSEFLRYCVKRNNYYKSYEDENPDGESEEEELDYLDCNEKSEVIEESGMNKSFLLEVFCEFYLLKLGDKERLLHFLKTNRIPYAKQHLIEISTIYE